MTTSFRKHFPENGARWKKYFKAMLPMILASSLFALNGFIDNFMVGTIKGGNEGLYAVNTWTGITMGIFVGISSATTMVQTQFYFAKRYDKAKEVARLRFLLSIFFAICVSMGAWLAPVQMFGLFLKGGPDTDAMHNAVDYGRLITIQWLLLAFTFNFGNQLREIGHAKITMFWGIGTLITNATLNGVLILVVGMGVEGAAIATIVARVIAGVIAIWFYLSKKIQIGFSPMTLFKISLPIWKEFFKRWYIFLAASTVIFFINFRGHFYTAAFPKTVDPNASILGVGINAGTVLSLSSAIMNVFTTTFNALAGMAALFVGSNLGKGDIEKAKKNSHELKGFNTTISAFFSVIIVIFATVVPYMSFLYSDQFDDKHNLIRDGHANLINVRNSLYVIAFYYPMWIWFSTSYRNGMSGGKGSWFVWTDWIITGPVQIAWLAIMAVILPHSTFLQHNFWAYYALFFVSDILKLIFQEIWYYKFPWAFSITEEFAKKEAAAAQDEIRNLNKRD